MQKKEHHPLIYDYLKKYQEDPSSRIFAPLAEAYRKSGLVDEAIEIAREGLKVHPRFMSGKVALARALFDKELYSEVVEELLPIVQEIPDNLVAQRLLAEACLMVDRVADAIQAYKMLLYFSPGDLETARIVNELEAQAYQKGILTLKNFDVQSAEGAIDKDPAAVRAKKIRKIEVLQQLLQRVERYRTLNKLGVAWNSSS